MTVKCTVPGCDQKIDPCLLAGHLAGHVPDLVARLVKTEATMASLLQRMEALEVKTGASVASVTAAGVRLDLVDIPPLPSVVPSVVPPIAGLPVVPSPDGWKCKICSQVSANRDCEWCSILPLLSLNSKPADRKDAPATSVSVSDGSVSKQNNGDTGSDDQKSAAPSNQLPIVVPSLAATVPPSMKEPDHSTIATASDWQTSAVNDCARLAENFDAKKGQKVTFMYHATNKKGYDGIVKSKNLVNCTRANDRNYDCAFANDNAPLLAFFSIALYKEKIPTTSQYPRHAAPQSDVYMMYLKFADFMSVKDELFLVSMRPVKGYAKTYQVLIVVASPTDQGYNFVRTNCMRLDRETNPVLWWDSSASTWMMRSYEKEKIWVNVASLRAVPIPNKQYEPAKKMDKPKPWYRRST